MYPSQAAAAANSAPASAFAFKGLAFFWASKNDHSGTWRRIGRIPSRRASTDRISAARSVWLHVSMMTLCPRRSPRERFKTVAATRRHAAPSKSPVTRQPRIFGVFGSSEEVPGTVPRAYRCPVADSVDLTPIRSPELFGKADVRMPSNSREPIGPRSSSDRSLQDSPALT
jgi:hypothetical protein